MENIPIYKILIVGGDHSGKSCLILQYTDKVFHESYLPTIGVDFKVRTIKKNDQDLKLQIWDTAGQERFQTITSSYYKKTHGFMVCCDITHKECLSHLEQYLAQIEKFGNSASTNKILLVGTKSDLDAERVVQMDTMLKFASSKNMPYIETSAKANINVEQAFETLLDLILADIPDN